MLDVATGSFEGFVCILLLIVVCVLLCCIIYYLKKTNDALREGNKAHCQSLRRSPKVVEHHEIVPALQSVSVQHNAPKPAPTQKTSVKPKSEVKTPLLVENVQPAPKAESKLLPKAASLSTPEAESPSSQKDPQHETTTHSTETTTTITTYKVEKKPGQPDEITKTVETITVPENK